MKDKFDPAPFDKYAVDSNKAVGADLDTSSLDEAIMESFPASDPVSFAQPAPGDLAKEGTPGTGENICPKCEGSGKYHGQECENCRGSGKVIGGVGGG